MIFLTTVAVTVAACAAQAIPLNLEDPAMSDLKSSHMPTSASDCTSGNTILLFALNIREHHHIRMANISRTADKRKSMPLQIQTTDSNSCLKFPPHYK